MKFFQVTNLVIFFFLIAGVTNSLWFFLCQVDNWEIFPTLYFGVSRWEFLFSFNSIDLQTHFFWICEGFQGFKFQFLVYWKVKNYTTNCLIVYQSIDVLSAYFSAFLRICLPVRRSVFLSASLLAWLSDWLNR